MKKTLAVLISLVLFVGLVLPLCSCNDGDDEDLGGEVYVALNLGVDEENYYLNRDGIMLLVQDEQCFAGEIVPLELVSSDGGETHLRYHYTEWDESVNAVVERYDTITVRKNGDALDFTWEEAGLVGSSSYRFSDCLWKTESGALYVELVYEDGYHWFEDGILNLGDKWYLAEGESCYEYDKSSGELFCVEDGERELEGKRIEHGFVWWGGVSADVGYTAEDINVDEVIQAFEAFGFDEEQIERYLESNGLSR